MQVTRIIENTELYWVWIQKKENKCLNQNVIKLLKNYTITKHFLKNLNACIYSQKCIMLDTNMITFANFKNVLSNLKYIGKSNKKLLTNANYLTDYIILQ